MTKLSKSRVLPAAFAVLTAIAQPSSAQDTALTVDQTRDLAIDLVNAGEFEAAQQVATALLNRDSSDVVALIAIARIAEAQGDFPQAVDAATRAFRLAPDDPAAFVAARLAARAHLMQNNFTRSQIWLRLARQYAPDGDASDAVAEDYQFLRDINPLSVDLTFGIQPSSNINGGSQSETAFISLQGNPLLSALLGDGLDLPLSRDAQALSGLAYTLGAGVSYRIHESETSRTVVTASLDTTTYTLSDSSKDDLEEAARADEARGLTDSAQRLRDIEGSDYAFTQLALGVGHDVVLKPGMLPALFSARIGTNWYGGDPYQDFIDLSFGQSFRTSDRSRLRLSFGAQKDFADDNVNDAESVRIGATYSYVLDRGDLISASISNRNVRSENFERDYNTVAVGVDYQLNQPVMGVDLTFGLTADERRLDFSPLSGGARSDTTVSLTANAGFTQIEYFGFQPVAKLELSRTNSDNARFDRTFIGLGLDLRSAF